MPSQSRDPAVGTLRISLGEICHYYYPRRWRYDRTAGAAGSTTITDLEQQSCLSRAPNARISLAPSACHLVSA